MPRRTDTPCISSPQHCNSSVCPVARQGSSDKLAMRVKLLRLGGIASYTRYRGICQRRFLHARLRSISGGRWTSFAPPYPPRAAVRLLTPHRWDLQATPLPAFRRWTLAAHPPCTRRPAWRRSLLPAHTAARPPTRPYRNADGCVPVRYAAPRRRLCSAPPCTRCSVLVSLRSAHSSRSSAEKKPDRDGEENGCGVPQG
jgi:hypothetical protein